MGGRAVSNLLMEWEEVDSRQLKVESEERARWIDRADMGRSSAAPVHRMRDRRLWCCGSMWAV
jgi:hypothetical protein